MAKQGCLVAFQAYFCYVPWAAICESLTDNKEDFAQLYFSVFFKKFIFKLEVWEHWICLICFKKHHPFSPPWLSPHSAAIGKSIMKYYLTCSQHIDTKRIPRNIPFEMPSLFKLSGVPVFLPAGRWASLLASTPSVVWISRAWLPWSLPALSLPTLAYQQCLLCAGPGSSGAQVRKSQVCWCCVCFCSHPFPLFTSTAHLSSLAWGVGPISHFLSDWCFLNLLAQSWLRAKFIVDTLEVSEILASSSCPSVFTTIEGTPLGYTFKVYLQPRFIPQTFGQTVCLVLHRLLHKRLLLTWPIQWNNVPFESRLAISWK